MVNMDNALDIKHWIKIPLEQLVKDNPLMIDFLLSFSLNSDTNESFEQLVENLNDCFWEDHNLTAHELINHFIEFAQGITTVSESYRIETLEILSGRDKSGKEETCNLTIKPGEITCIVGPTGSGKSRLLADIEWLANADTHTRRRILLNGKPVTEDFISNMGGKLIAQITQNMNFVLDMSVYDFLLLHAQSRFLEKADQKVTEVIALANELSGEGFKPETPVTFLSGGQSRALMIADVACIGQAPIVLIDEIENAGVDKKKALDLLVSNDKIVLMATHDPLLILQANKRVVIKNGGMDKIIHTTNVEKEFLKKLEELDATMQRSRNFFRFGNQLTSEKDLSLS